MVYNCLKSGAPDRGLERTARPVLLWTGWLVTSGNVVPGETIEIRFAMWDTGGGWYDSVVLLNNFVWSLDASEPGTHQ